MNLH
ncbi:uncharacterized protein FFM5_15324 [Fusarium fujikuroi]|jgi:hypothetical protein